MVQFLVNTKHLQQQEQGDHSQYGRGYCMVVRCCRGLTNEEGNQEDRSDTGLCKRYPHPSCESDWRRYLSTTHSYEFARIGACSAHCACALLWTVACNTGAWFQAWTYCIARQAINIHIYLCCQVPVEEWFARHCHLDQRSTPVRFEAVSRDSSAWMLGCKTPTEVDFGTRRSQWLQNIVSRRLLLGWGRTLCAHCYHWSLGSLSHHREIR